MGLTKAQWQTKRINEIKEIVKQKGKKIDKSFYLEGKNPFIVKDVCVFGVYVNENDELLFGDLRENGFHCCKKGVDTERTYLEEILDEIK